MTRRSDAASPGKAVGRVGLRRDAAGRERTLAVALQRVDGGHPPLGVGERAPRPLRPPRRDDLALGARRLAELAGQLGVARVLLQDGDALRAALALGPEVERPAPEVGRVAVGVDRGTLGDRLQQRVERARGVACRDPVRGDLPAVAAGARELLGEPAVERSAAQPGDVVVQRIARERVAEGGAARLGLDDQPAGEQLGEPASASESATRSSSNRGPATAASSATARASSERPAVRTSTASRTVRGSGTSPSTSSSRPSGRGAQPPGRAQRRGQLLDEEGRPAGAVVQGPGQPRRTAAIRRAAPRGAPSPARSAARR